jgi:hypothetical protein
LSVLVRTYVRRTDYLTHSASTYIINMDLLGKQLSYWWWLGKQYDINTALSRNTTADLSST